jgi:uncharacterized protein YidB (DUF937 family)
MAGIGSFAKKWRNQQMSGLLGQILGSVLGGNTQSGQPSAIAGIVQQIIAGSGGAGGQGGVAALVTRFEAVGLGQHAQSWVGAGENTPVSANDVSKAFSADEIQTWAQQAGTSPDAITKVLAEALPKAVDHVTPGGQMPAQNTDLAAMLTKFLGSQGNRTA